MESFTYELQYPSYVLCSANVGNNRKTRRFCLCPISSFKNFDLTGSPEVFCAYIKLMLFCLLVVILLRVLFSEYAGIMTKSSLAME
jgi:hypothetical protein